MPQETITLECETPSTDMGSFEPVLSSFSPGWVVRGWEIRVGVLFVEAGWFRYKVPLTKYDAIDEAYLEVTSRYQSNYAPPTSQFDGYDITLKANKHDNSAAPTNHSEAVTQSTTNATTAYASQHVGYISGPDQIQHIGGLRLVLKEIIDRAGWASNNHICLNGTCSRVSGSVGAYWKNSYRDYVNDPTQTTKFPKLVIKYRAGVGSNHAVASDLVIEQSIHAHWVSKLVENILTFTQDITHTQAQGRLVEHILSIVSQPHAVQTVLRELIHLVLPQQDILGMYVASRNLESNVNILQDIVGNANKVKEINHVISILQDIIKNRSYNISQESLVALLQDIRHDRNTRFFEHSLNIQPFMGINPIQQFPEDQGSTLVISQDITRNVVRTRAIEHTLSITQAVLGYFDPILPSPGASGGFGGFSGGAPGGGSPSAPSSPGGGLGGGDTPSPIIVKDYRPRADASVHFPTLPVLNPAATPITLECPPVIPIFSITLPSPLFSNREELQLTRIQRHTRGGVLKTFSDTSWPKVRIFRYKFDSLETSKIEEFFTFLSQTLGQKIRLTDYEGRKWDGFIVNPAGESAQFFRQCGKTTEFDFDGVEV